MEIPIILTTCKRKNNITPLGKILSTIKVDPVKIPTSSSLLTITSLPRIQSPNNEMSFPARSHRMISRHRSLNIHSDICDNQRTSIYGDTALVQDKMSPSLQVKTNKPSSSGSYSTRSNSPDTVLEFQYNESVDSICSPESESHER